jgi:hypothetical protein
MMHVPIQTVRDKLAPYRLAREARLQQAEFVLKISHPEVFVSYRAAKAWALAELAANPKRYGGDHGSWSIHVFAQDEGYACSIHQYWWSADHCGAVRPTGALAIVQAVLEMQAGY